MPVDPAHVRLYVCGPTVYDRAHIGNARPVVVADVLVRLLRHLYPRVTYVRNVTDVDDKINARAAAAGEPIGVLTARTLADFHADMAALGALPPDVEPRATDHIAEMLAIIERLLERGHAYAADGHVLFAVASDPGGADHGEFDAPFRADGHWQDPQADWGNPEQTLHQKEFFAVLEACLAKLSKQTAQVFMMREHLGTPTDEICKVLEITSTHCWVMLYRARMSLRACLQQKWFTGVR